jgi:hypothetical protein
MKLLEIRGTVAMLVMAMFDRMTIPFSNKDDMKRRKRNVKPLESK